MKFTILTFGCKVNSYESEYMKEQLISNGYIYNEDYKTSDIVIINTCSVTNTADGKCKKMIRNVRRDNDNVILMVCGCSAENLQNDLEELNIDILIGNKDKSKVVSLINKYIESNNKYVCFNQSKALPFENMIVESFDDLTRAFVKIQDGCNNYCSYCIIPYVRGNIRSKKFDDVVLEVGNLVKNGHKEIVFTGINTGVYGKETGNYDLTDLIREVSKYEELERIRISSIDITEIDEKFINELKENKKLCGHLHISLQSGAARILKLMNRKYTKEEYFEKVQMIRKARKNINLTTDVIVGFPSETEEDFQECVEFCKKVGFSKIHVFPYSIRKGTKAANMKEQIPNNIKKDRARRLIEIDNEMQKSYNDKFLGFTVRVLIEEVNDGISVGHTENYLKVEIFEELNKNTFYDVEIIKSYFDKVEGKVK